MSYDVLSSSSQSQKVGQSFLKSIFESGQVMTFKRKCHKILFFFVKTDYIVLFLQTLRTSSYEYVLIEQANKQKDEPILVDKHLCLMCHESGKVFNLLY